MKPYKNRRRILELRHDGQSWYLREKQLRLDTFIGLPKKDAVRWSRRDCRDLRSEGFLVQLRIYKKNGQIETEATYGKDPKHRKG